MFIYYRKPNPRAIIISSYTLYSMRNDKENAIQLRKSGKSYSEIKAQLGVPKSTLSGWLAPKEWSKNITHTLNQKYSETNKIRIQHLNKIRGKFLEDVYKEAEKEALEEFERLKYHPLFIAGLMLYWGEGDKLTKYNVSLANTDPGMIRLFVHFLVHVCQIEQEKIKIHLLLYPDLNERKSKIYWKLHTGLEEKNFTKSTIIQGRHKTRRLQYGVCSAIFSSTYLKRKLIVWLKLMSENLLDSQYYKIKRI